jgi:hypothetical protein
MHMINVKKLSSLIYKSYPNQTEHNIVNTQYVLKKLNLIFIFNINK